MPQARITINAVAGSNIDLPIGVLVQLSNQNIGGELTYRWTIANQPAGSTDSLSATNIQSPTFTPRKEGTYRISLIVNEGLASEVRDEVVAAVLQLKTRTRVPAVGETDEASGTVGWAGANPGTPGANPTLQLLDARMADPDFVVAQISGSPSALAVVRMTSNATIKAGLPGEEKVPVLAPSLATDLLTVTQPLGVLISAVDGGALSNGKLANVKRGGMITAVPLVGAVIGNAIYVSDTAALSLTAGTNSRQVGYVVATTGTECDIWFDGRITFGAGGSLSFPLLAPDDSAAAPSYSFASDPDMGMFRRAADQLGFATLGVERLAITDAAIFTTVAGGIDLGDSDVSPTHGGEPWNFGYINLIRTATGNLTTPALAFDIERDTGIYRPGADQFGVAVRGVLVGTFRAPSGANPQILAPLGSAGWPGLAFIGDEDTGLFRPSANAICIAIGGAERWRIFGSTFAASTNGNTISQSVANGGLNIQCNLTTATDDRVGISVANVSSPAISSGSLRLMEVRFPINMSGTAGYTVLDVIANETATGSGDKWLIGAKSGAGGTTRVFGVKNDGSVLVGNGSAGAPSLSFLSTPTSGLYLDGANIAWTVASAKRGEFSSTGIAWANNSNFVVSNGANNRSLTLTGRYNTGAGPSVILNNAVNFVASAATEQTLVSAQINVAQAGSGGYTVLNLQATETSLGSGEKYLIRAKSGPANEQRFAVDYRGNIIFSTTRQLRDHTTSPEGAVTAPVGSIVVVEDTSVLPNNGIWAKINGSGAAGWEMMSPSGNFVVQGFEDFDKDTIDWTADVGANANAARYPNLARLGFPGNGVIVAGTTNNSQNSVSLQLASVGLAFDTNSPIVTEWKFVPFSAALPAPTTPGATSALTGTTSAGASEVLGVPALTGEIAAPFYVELDNGVDPAETVRVKARVGTTLVIDGTTTYAYAPGDTAAYAGPAAPLITFANDEFTWLMGVAASDGYAVGVLFGGIWDNGSSTMTNVIALREGNTVTTQAVTLPALTAQYYRARLTITASSAVLEVADGDGAFSTIGTLATTIPPFVYTPIVLVNDGYDNRFLAIDWLRWRAARLADNVAGDVASRAFAVGGTYTPTFTTSGGGTAPSVSDPWVWSRVGKFVTVYGRFSKTDDPGVADGFLEFSLPIERTPGTASFGSALGRVSGSSTGVAAMVDDQAMVNFPYDLAGNSEWAISFTFYAK